MFRLLMVTMMTTMQRVLRGLAAAAMTQKTRSRRIGPRQWQSVHEPASQLRNWSIQMRRVKRTHRKRDACLMSVSVSTWSLRWHFTNRSVAGAFYSINSYSLSHSWTLWWRVRWLNQWRLDVAAELQRSLNFKATCSRAMRALRSAENRSKPAWPAGIFTRLSKMVFRPTRYNQPYDWLYNRLYNWFLYTTGCLVYTHAAW